MAERPQNYKNHARLFPLFHFFVAPLLTLNLFVEARRLFLTPTHHQIWAFLVAAALFGLALAARTMALRVQDRVIRLEMRQRLALCLPDDLRGRILDLTPAQLVALRFASDAEMPNIVRDVLEGKLPSGKAIKLRVKDWQADWLRA